MYYPGSTPLEEQAGKAHPTVTATFPLSIISCLQRAGTPLRLDRPVVLSRCTVLLWARKFKTSNKSDSHHTHTHTPAPYPPPADKQKKARTNMYGCTSPPTTAHDSLPCPSLFSLPAPVRASPGPSFPSPQDHLLIFFHLPECP